MQVTVPLIVPKAFKAKKALLIHFDLYVKTIRNFCIATGKDAATDNQKVVLLHDVGGPNMADLVEEVGKVNLVAIASRINQDTPTSRPTSVANTH